MKVLKNSLYNCYGGGTVFVTFIKYILNEK